jgi:hypothetical protein
MALGKTYSTKYLVDSNGNTGAANQVLVSTATGVDWVDGSGSGIIGGPYLPLSAGSGYPLTGDLYITKAATPLIQLTDTTNSKTLLLGVDDANAFIRTGAGENFYLQVNGGTNAITILNDSNVGIGDTNPGRKLVLDGTLGTPALEIKKNTDRIVYLGTGSSASADDNTILHLMDQNVVKINLNTVGDSYLNGGNVGIGTTNPNAPLHIVKDTGGVDAVLRLRGTNTTSRTTRLQFEDYNGTIADALIDFIIPTAGSSTGARLGIGIGSETISIINGGNVGIGTTAPTSKLSVFSDSATIPRIGRFVQNNSGTSSIGALQAVNAASTGSALDAGSWTQSSSDWIFRGYGNVSRAENGDVSGAGSVFKFGIRADGNVGIGTTSPSRKLHVNGDVQVDTNLVVNSGIYNTTYYAGSSTATYFKNSVASTTLTILQSGNVGIGTTSPFTNLEIEGSGLDSIIRLYTATGAANIRTWEMRAVGVAGEGLLFRQVNDANTVYTNRMILDNSGNVGIGTTSPGSKLEINENSTGTVYSKVFNQNAGVSATARMAVVAESAQLDIIATSAGYTGVSGWADSGVISTDSGASGGLILNAQTGGLKLQTGLSTKMVVLTSGNVGIGTTSPGEKLEVNGVISGILGLNVGANSLGTDRMFQISGTSFTTGTSQFGIVNNPTMTTPTTLYGYYGGVTVTSATNSYAMYLEATSGTVTNKYGIYQTGTGDKNYFAGNVGIGTDSPGAKLHVSGGMMELDDGYGLRWGDNSVGIYGNAANETISMYTSASERIRIDSSGNVGIGTTAPFGTAANRTVLSVNGTTDVSLNVGTGGSQRAYLYGSSTYADLGTIGSLPLVFSPNNTERMRISSAGNVGIGTISPAAKLDIGGNAVGSVQAIFGRGNDNSAFTVRYTNGNAGVNNTVQGTIGLDYANGVWADMAAIKFIRDSTAGILAFYTSTSQNSGVERLRITSAGNVGIGTTSPTAKLQVVGTSTYNSDAVKAFRVSDSTTITKAVDIGYDAALDAGFIQAGYFGVAYRHLLLQPNDNNVGIGTVSPGAKLDVSGEVRTSSNFIADNATLGSLSLRISGTETGRLDNYNSALRLINFHASSATVISGNGDISIESIGSSAIKFSTSNAEKMRIDSSGNVGIGDTNPVTPLQVTSATNAVDVLRIGNTAGNSGSVAGVTHLAINHFNSGTNPSTRITAYQDGVSGWPGGMYFSTREVNTDSAPLERLRITSAGSIGINTTNPTSRLEVVGDARITTGSLGVGVAPNATDGRIDASNDIVAYSTSDKRLKENITPITNALEKVRSLTGVEFDWKQETESVHGYEGHDVGVIAQEVQAVLPEAVRTNESGYLSVRYEKMIALLVEAMKEQQAEIDELKKLIK